MDVNNEDVEPIMTALTEILGERPAVVIISNDLPDLRWDDGDPWWTYTVIETDAKSQTTEAESWIENDDADAEDVKAFLARRDNR